MQRKGDFACTLAGNVIRQRRLSRGELARELDAAQGRDTAIAAERRAAIPMDGWSIRVIVRLGFAVTYQFLVGRPYGHQARRMMDIAASSSWLANTSSNMIWRGSGKIGSVLWAITSRLPSTLAQRFRTSLVIAEGRLIGTPVQ